MDIEKLKKIGTVKKFNQGEYLCRQGEVDREMYIILSGQVGIYGSTLGSNPERYAVLGSGSFFGEMSVLDDLPNSSSVIAETPLIVLSIAKDTFHRLIREEPDVALNIMHRLVRRIRKLEEKLLEIHGTEKNELPSIEESIVSPAAAERVTVKETSVLPEGHRVYNVWAPETHKNYFYEKKVTCPLCGKDFMTKNSRMTRIRLIKRENDLREKYADFEPLWYNIRTCPHCFYSENYNDFDKLKKFTDDALQPYREKERELQGKIVLPPLEPLSIDRVFLSYYLAIYYVVDGQENPLKLAKLYMALSWLYQDVDDEELYRRSWNKAFDYYYQAYYGVNKARLKPEHEQQLCLVLGELYLRKGDVQQALKHFYAAIRRHDGTNYYNNLARERYQDVREKAK